MTKDGARTQDRGLKNTRVCPHYLGNDAAELRSILGEGQQVADGTADGVYVV